MTGKTMAFNLVDNKINLARKELQDRKDEIHRHVLAIVKEMGELAPKEGIDVVKYPYMTVVLARGGVLYRFPNNSEFFDDNLEDIMFALIDEVIKEPRDIRFNYLDLYENILNKVKSIADKHQYKITGKYLPKE
jgi:hypothetical protein